METGILERMRLIINYYNLSERQFATRIGVGQPALNTMFHRNQDNIKLTTIVNIIKAFPEVSIDWLVLGNGDMLSLKTEDASESVKILMDTIKSLNYTIAEQKKRIEQLEASQKMGKDNVLNPNGFVSEKMMFKK